MRTAWIAFLIALSLSACVTTYYYKPAASQPGQKEAVYTRGLPGLRSRQFGADLTAGLSARGEKDLSLLVYIYNDSDSAYTFHPEDVQVSGYDAFGQKTDLRVFGAEEYIRWKNTRDALIATGIVIGTVAAIVAISEATDSHAYNASDHSRNFYYTLDWIDWSLYTTMIIVDHTPPPPPRPEMEEDGLLRTHTLRPGDAIQGVIKVRGKPHVMHRILVEIPVNGAYHQFAFENRRPVR